MAFAGLGVLLATNVLTLEDINLQGSTLVTFLWLAVLFALSGQLNELGFMGYVGGRLTALLGGIAWPVAYVVLLVLYVLMHYMFVSQSAQVLALFGVFLDVGVRTGVPASLMAFALLFASSYFSTITPQGWQPERHLRRQQLPDPGRALLARPADHGVLSTHVPGAGNALAAFRRTVTQGHIGKGALSRRRVLDQRPMRIGPKTNCSASLAVVSFAPGHWYNCLGYRGALLL